MCIRDSAWAEAGYKVPTALAGQDALRVVVPQPLNGSHGGYEPVDAPLPVGWADDISLISD